MDYLEEYRCPVCTTRHPFRSCRRFLVLTPAERTRVVERYKACQNCLGLSHTESNCRSKFRCHNCKARHHTLLHGLDEYAVEWLQMTAWARMHRPGRVEEKRMIRVLLDPNLSVSQVIITSLLFPFKIPDGLDNLDLQLTDRHSDVRTLTATLKVIRGPSPFTPHRPCSAGKMVAKYGLRELADFAFHLPYGCCVILGADVTNKIYLGLPQIDEDSTYAQNTIFGWSFFGAAPLEG